MKNSNIQWTDHTWNIAVGCSKVDEDCLFCYMYRDSLKGTRYDPKKVRKTKTVFNTPLKIKEPSKIFTSSLTDVFHEDIDSFRDEMWDIIRRCPQHTFQILTKRPERIKDHLPSDWGDGWDNVWIGVSVGHPDALHRAMLLSHIKAKVKFLSIEPLWGEVDLGWPKSEYPNGPPMCCDGRMCGCQGLPIDPPIAYYFNWVIIGGESGNENGQYRYRECKLEWIESIVKSCKFANVPVFVKQLGTHLAKQLSLVDRHGGNIDEWPEHLKVREFPASPYQQLKKHLDDSMK